MKDKIFQLLDAQWQLKGALAGLKAAPGVQLFRTESIW